MTVDEIAARYDEEQTGALAIELRALIEGIMDVSGAADLDAVEFAIYFLRAFFDKRRSERQ